MQFPGELVPIALFVCAAAAAIFVPIARAYAKRLAREPLEPLTRPDVAARLERVEQALDTIAVEIERISENQRFTTRLLSERADRPPAGSLPENPA